MKILFLIDSLDKGGRERRLIELMKGLLPEPDIALALVLFSRRVDYQEIYDFGVPIYFLERRPKKDPTIFFRLHQICKQEQPDIIHSWGIMPSIYAIPTARLLGIRLINACIADAPAHMNWLDKRYLRARATFLFSDVIVGNSLAGLAAYQVPEHKARCVYNGFDFRRISQMEDAHSLRKKYGLQTGLVVGMVGAFYDRKDYDTFFSAGLQMLKDREDLNFLAIGDGPNRLQYQSQIPSALRDRFLLPGMVHQVESLINLFDIGVLTTYTEGISNSIMEYMVLGKPVVATEGGGTRELVEDGNTGYLIPPKDPEALVEKLTFLLNQAEWRNTMGQKGKARIYDHFSLERMEKEYMALYQELVPNARSHSKRNL